MSYHTSDREHWRNLIAIHERAIQYIDKVMDKYESRGGVAPVSLIIDRDLRVAEIARLTDLLENTQ